ncbi:radical SAM protein [Rugamonas sp. FT81W]|uniref:Radical SAM protein n=2 Tax=Duganella vulcania TaxID=2692166 RepID=A0A845GHS0_9BURK|nr:radical SAM protein [Duganella vulcania]
MEIAKATPLADNFYLGLPFCIPTVPSHCGFCLFPTQDYKGNSGMQTYLEYLEREAELYAPFLANDRLSSMYVGGGTPNLLKAEDYGRLTAIAEKLYGKIPDDVERTIEGIPQLFSKDKVDAIRAAGFNRVSMGVQQMSDKLIKYSGRRQTHRQVMDALDHFNAAKLAVNVDLIYGWPEQTVADMLRDLGELVDQGVRHITHYQLNIAGRSDFSKAQRELLPSLETTIDMYKESCAFLRSKGYRQATVYDWEKVESMPGRFESPNADRYQYEQNLRDFLHADDQSVTETRNMIGLGYAGVSFPFTWPVQGGPNWSQMNLRNLDAYFQSIDAGKLPVEKQFLYNKEDLKLAWLFQSMQSMTIDLHNYAVAFGADLLHDYAPIFDELHKRSWIEIDAKQVRFIGLGEFFIPMIQALFSYARLNEMRGGLKQIVEGKKIINILETA